MTKKDIKRYGILNDLIKGSYTVPEAAKLLNISDRQVQRLKKAILEKGVEGIIHKNRVKSQIILNLTNLFKKY